MSIKSSNILQNTYRVVDCSDFSDISASMETILENCSIYNVSIFDFKAVYLRFNGLVQLFYKSEKFRKQSDIDYSKTRDSYHTDIMNYIKIFKNKNERIKKNYDNNK